MNVPSKCPFYTGDLRINGMGRSHHQANILLSRPSLRGSTPLDIAYSSLMDNTELALAMREHHLEKIAVYLSRCGLTSNAELTAKGYPDLGWVSTEHVPASL